MHVQPAQIIAEQLQKIRALEQETGTVLLALEQPHKVADLDAEQLSHLQQTEQQLDCIVVAYARD